MNLSEVRKSVTNPSQANHHYSFEMGQGSLRSPDACNQQGSFGKPEADANQLHVDKDKVKQLDMQDFVSKLLKKKDDSSLQI